MRTGPALLAPLLRGGNAQTNARYNWLPVYELAALTGRYAVLRGGYARARQGLPLPRLGRGRFLGGRPSGLTAAREGSPRAAASVSRTKATISPFFVQRRLSALYMASLTRTVSRVVRMSIN